MQIIMPCLWRIWLFYPIIDSYQSHCEWCNVKHPHNFFLYYQRGQGAPAREPVVSQEDQKHMMAYYYKKQEEFKVRIKLQNCFFHQPKTKRILQFFSLSATNSPFFTVFRSLSTVRGEGGGDPSQWQISFSLKFYLKKRKKKIKKNKLEDWKEMEQKMTCIFSWPDSMVGTFLVDRN